MGKKSASAGRQKPTPAKQQPACKPSSSQSSKSNNTVAHALSLSRQQGILNIFSDAFDAVLTSETFPALLQEIKQALFNREFDVAFGWEDYLEAYAARWSPTRALCYGNVFIGLKKHFEAVCTTVGEDAGRKNLRMMCIGGCAAEHVAFATLLGHRDMKGSLTLLDAAPWSHVSNLLQDRLTSPPPISKYASAEAKAANTPLLPEPDQLSLHVQQNDALALSADEWKGLVGAETPLVVTLMFTLNELYTHGGIGKTTKLLKTLGAVLPSGSLLLVVDSPGSYSEAALGKEKKRYPMQWLLNHTLLETENDGFAWTRLESEESLWCRLSEELVYPIQLENMRYQMHLYRVDKSPAQ
ncbi:hypothetical protein K4F52_005442 [Lecanicillium sp. MT-2017a]|nr:hypothetical protein K4F52_005442 [Lecanicillium sp. MT-2017a]